jgi:formylglycine-generating enzyme required for sulfatase activity
VGKLNKNPWGLYDMSGNVYQFCADRYGDYRDGPITDPRGPDTSDLRVCRGGSWGRWASDCRSAYRSKIKLDYRDSILGFRVVLSP